MASSIDFGTLSTTGTTPRLSGTSSDLDTEALINALTDAKRIPALRLENKITENEAKLAAYSDLRGLMSDLQSSIQGLRNPPGLTGLENNLFEAKDVFFSSSTTTSPAELVGVSASNQAATGSFGLVVDQLAAARKFSSASTNSADQTLGDAFGDGSGIPVAGPDVAGTITIGLDGSGTNASIAVDHDMTIYDLNAAINAQSADAGVQSSVLKVSDTEYRLVVTATETGKEVVLGGNNETLDLLGLSADGGASFENSLQAPQEARITVDGVTITRSSNQISDAVEGITFNLFKADPSTTITVDVEPALNGVKESLNQFVNAYNAFRDFVDQQSVVGEGGAVGEGSVLFGDSTLRGLERSISGIISNPVSGLDTDALRSLGAIGITLDANNKLSIDDQKLDSLLLEDLDAVRDVMEFRFTSSSPDLSIFARGGALSDTEFTVDIVDSNNDGIIESATIDGVAVDVDGQFIIGQEGTAYAGLELFWSGTGSTSINATATSGVAERLFTGLDTALNNIDGTLSSAVESLETINETYRNDIARIDLRVENYREQLIEKYSAMEAALSLAEAMLNQIRATSEALTADNG